jgi:hypothetical protein
MVCGLCAGAKLVESRQTVLNRWGCLLGILLRGYGSSILTYAWCFEGCWLVICEHFDLETDRFQIATRKTPTRAHGSLRALTWIDQSKKGKS